MFDIARHFEEPADGGKFDPRHPDFILPIHYTKKTLLSYGLSRYGRQTVNGVLVLPKEYFLIGLPDPRLVGLPDLHRVEPAITPQTICYHPGGSSWRPVLLEYRKPWWRKLARNIFERTGLLKTAILARRILWEKVMRRRPGRSSGW
jgi:hypothetical protein